MLEITPNTEMKIITLWQPWASWMFLIKQKETRSWSTRHRGLVAIHSANRKMGQFEKGLVLEIQARLRGLDPSLCNLISSCEYPLGQILSVGNLDSCDQMCFSSSTPPRGWISVYDVSELERKVGDWGPDRYAWGFSESAILATPIPCKGGQGLRNLSSDVVANISQVLKND